MPVSQLKKKKQSARERVGEKEWGGASISPHVTA